MHLAVRPEISCRALDMNGDELWPRPEGGRCSYFLKKIMAGEHSPQKINYLVKRNCLNPMLPPKHAPRAVRRFLPNAFTTTICVGVVFVLYWYCTRRFKFKTQRADHSYHVGVSMPALPGGGRYHLPLEVPVQSPSPPEGGGGKGQHPNPCCLWCCSHPTCEQ
jgi:hypothetical protein